MRNVFDMLKVVGAIALGMFAIAFGVLPSLLRVSYPSRSIWFRAGYFAVVAVVASILNARQKPLVSTTAVVGAVVYCWFIAHTQMGTWTFINWGYDLLFLTLAVVGLLIGIKLLAYVGRYYRGLWAQYRVR